MKRLLAVLLLIPALAGAQSQKISEMPSGSPAQSGDMIPIARSGANYRLDAADFCMAGSCAITSTGANMATVGSEIATNASFTTDLSGWSGTNWAWAAGGKALHTAGATTALSQNVTITSGTAYMVTFNVSGGTAGSIDIALGSQSVRLAVITGALYSGDTKYILSTQSGSVALTATPTTDFNGNLDYFGIQAFTAEHGVSLTLKDVSGTAVAPFRVNLDFPNSTNLFLGNDAGRWSSNSAETIAIGQLSQRNVGWNALGYRNTTLGAYSGMELTTGIENVAVGQSSLASGTSATRNVALGRQAMNALRSGGSNVAIGFQAMNGSSYAESNVAIGPGALTAMSASAAVPTGARGNTAIGGGGNGGGPGFNYFGGGATLSVTTGTFNTLIGAGTGQCSATQRTNATVLGYNACFDADNVMVLGNSDVTDVIFGNGPATAAAPYANASARTVTVTRGVRGGSVKNLTDGAAAVAVWQCNTSGYLGGEILWVGRSTDGTDSRSLTGRIRISGMNKAGTNTCTINVVGTDLLASTNANTLVCTWTNVASGAACLPSVTCTDNTASSQVMSVTSFYEMPEYGLGCVPQ